MQTAGYSGRSLEQKLGLKNGMTVKLVHAPDNYFNLMLEPPNNLMMPEDRAEPKDFIHFFTREEDELIAFLPHLKNELKPDGCIWVSWPKKTSGVPTTINGDSIRNWALSIGLVDVKVCAVDSTWSGLKLVIPVKNRPPGKAGQKK